MIVLITILFLGGSGAFGPLIFINEADDNAKVVITDTDHRKEVRATLKLMKGATKDYMGDVKDLQNGLGKEFTSHETNSADVDGYWNQVFELNSEFSEEIVDLRFELREQVSRDEWAGLFPVDE